MDLPFLEDFTHVGLDSWHGAMTGSTKSPPWAPLTCGNTRRLPTLASILSFLDVRSQKSEVFQR